MLTMEPRLTLRVAFILIIVPTGMTHHDLGLIFCGTWRHIKGPLSLDVNLSTGCGGISVSANQNSLSIDGQITAQCRRSDVIQLEQFGLDSEEESKFCLYWGPLWDQLRLQIKEENLILCSPARILGSCCTDLSLGPNKPEAYYGIINGSVNSDLVTTKAHTGFEFFGKSTNCKALCDEQVPPGTSDFMPRESYCARSYEEDMQDFTGLNLTSPTTVSESKDPVINVQIPPALKQAAKNTSKVVVNFFTSNDLFQKCLDCESVLDEVVEITVENEVITNLPEPIRINFYHSDKHKTHSSKCVSWDTRKDPLLVNWLEDGCETRHHGTKHTECLCNHLTYFSILVQVEPRPVCHLLELTVITSLGCAVSVISCIVLIVYLLRKRRSTEQSIPNHLGLAVSFTLLNLLFFLTGVLANVAGKSVCSWVGAILHYTLLSSFAWMGIEVFHTFWLVRIIFTPFPKSFVWDLVGFGLPVVPVVILSRVGDIYGVREVRSCDDTAEPYLMCWMKDTDEAQLAHYLTNVTIVAVLVSLGIVILFMVYRKIRTKDEWRQHRVAFFSIWGLSCLFGTTWGLAFLSFGPLSEFIHFLFCIINSLQGFLLMLRFYMVDWIRKQAGGSALGSSSSGSTRQHMLQAPEKY